MRKSFPQIDMYKTGQNIKRIMLEKGMTVKDVQTYLELATPQSVYHWFNRRSLPPVDNLYALSNLFCMPMDMLLCGNRGRNFYFFEHSVYQRLYLYYEKYLELRVG